MLATQGLLKRNIISKERLDEQHAQNCNCLLIQYDWKGNDDVDRLLDGSLELVYVINDIAKRRTAVDFLGVIFDFAEEDCQRKRAVVEEFVSVLEGSHLSGIPPTFVFCIGSKKSISFKFNGHGRRWWYSIANKHITSFQAKRCSNFTRTLEKQLSPCPANTACGVMKLLICVALPSYFSDAKFQCLLHRTTDDDYLPLFLACAQPSTVRIIQSVLGWDVEGYCAPIWCTLVEADSSRDLKDVLKAIDPGCTRGCDLCNCSKRINLTSLSNVVLRSLSLNRDRIVCWKGFLHTLSRDECTLNSSSICQFEKAFKDGFLYFDN